MSLTQLRHTGQELGEMLEHLDLEAPIVIAIPRRGMIVAREVSRMLRAELDVILAGKVFTAGRTADAIGAVAMGGVRVIDENAAAAQGLRPRDIDVAFDAAERRIEERLAIVRGNLALPDLFDRVVIVVDDAAITGLTMQVAVGALSQRRPARIIVAVGCCSHDAAVRLDARTADVFALERLPFAVAEARHDAAAIALCPPLSDDEMHALLRGESVMRARPAEMLELDGLTAHDV